jgi:hypothetical protein
MFAVFEMDLGSDSTPLCGLARDGPSECQISKVSRPRARSVMLFPVIYTLDCYRESSTARDFQACLFVARALAKP